ncbi:pheromone precursor [Trametes sanguinea]|nr:pheromone precursor [Trametes sanguinea]
MDSFVCLTVFSDLASDPGNALTSDFVSREREVNHGSSSYSWCIVT